MKQILTLFALLAGLTMQAQVPSYVPTEGLVGYWGFNGNANDESGNGNDGTVNGATLTEDRFGNSNSAYDFDGVNDYISGNSSGSLNVVNTQQLSMSCWINVENFPPLLPNDSFSPSRIFTLSDEEVDITNQQYGLMGTGYGGIYWLAHGPSGFESNGGNATDTDNPLYSTGTWEYLTMTYDGDTIKLYHNASLVFARQQSDSFISGPTEYFTISSTTYNPVTSFNGKIDDIGIWNRALTEEEILALYNGCSVSIETIAGDLTPFTLEENTYNCTNTPGSTYEWEVEGGVITSGQGTSTVTVLWAEEGIGTLTVTETTEEGCEGSASVEVEIVCATTATTIEGPLGPGELIEVTYTCDGDASSTYNWSISNGVITSGQGTNTVNVIWASTGLGSITVQETTSADCDGEEITLDVVVVVATGIHETLTESINIFPNPASTSVTITIDESLINTNYQLFDAQGKLVSEGVLSKTNTTLNTTAFAAGNYVISIGNDQGVMRQQIIIER